MQSIKEGKRKKLDLQPSALPPLLDASPSVEMATTWGGLDTANESYPISVAKPSSSSWTPMCSIHKEPLRFDGVENMTKIIEAQCLSLQRGTSRDQYLSFQPVTLSELAEINQNRKQIGRDVRIRHYTDQNLLIVKLMPSCFHEASHSNFSLILRDKCTAMGLARQLKTTQATTYTGADGSSQEGDSSFKPIPARRGRESWPTVMIEAGWSESLEHLRIDAKWWLEQSRGDIKIVIIISVLSSGKKYHIEEWELKRQRTPKCFQEIDIDLDLKEVNGSPLILEFEKVFLRSCERNESDFIFTEQDLLEWAEDVWEVGLDTSS